MDKFYLVGQIVNTFGIKGEVKVLSDTSFERFKKGNTLYVYKDNNYIPITIDSSRVHQGFDLITFNGIKNINDVLEYKGLKIYSTHEEKLEEGHYYYEELIGLDALVDGKVIGKVSDIRELPKGILLELKIGDKTKLVPYEDEFIGEITESTIEIFPIEGLL